MSWVPVTVPSSEEIVRVSEPASLEIRTATWPSASVTAVSGVIVLPALEVIETL